tara:strand:- start:840 stop:1121 length:282 start_codon:yes stop_codon:yes gene_type:complete
MANPKQHALFQVTSFVDNANVDTFADRTLITRNPRCGQWVRLGWLDRRSRFIGTTRSGVLVLDHTSGGNFKKFSEKVRAFKRANDPQTRFPWG